MNKKQIRKNCSIHENPFLTKEMLDTPIYDEELMDQLYDGIVSNIMIEMDKRGMTTRGLEQTAGICSGHLAKAFSGKVRLGLPAIVKVAYALQISPRDLFPDDLNKRKTNGQRYDEITKELDVVSNNFLLGMCSDYVKEWKRIKRELRK